VVGLDFVELFDDGRMVGWEAAEFGERFGGFLVAIGLDQVTGGFGEEEEAGVSVSCEGLGI